LLVKLWLTDLDKKMHKSASCQVSI